MSASAKQRCVQAVLWSSGLFYLALAALMIGVVVLGSQLQTAPVVSVIMGRGIAGIVVSALVGIFTLVAAWKGRKHRGFPAVVIVVNCVLLVLFIAECVLAGIALSDCTRTDRYLIEVCRDEIKPYALALLALSVLLAAFGVWAGAMLLKVTKPGGHEERDEYVYMEASD